MSDNEKKPKNGKKKGNSMLFLNFNRRKIKLNQKMEGINKKGLIGPKNGTHQKVKKKKIL